MADFEIVVKRSGHSGTMTFAHGDVSVSTTCWWDLKVEIDAKSDGYVAYATRLAHKKDSVTHEKRPGIWLGKNVKYAHGTKSSNEIFIHEGNNVSWSDGCIVAKRGEVMKIWNAINPKEQPNVLVKVIDEAAGT